MTDWPRLLAAAVLLAASVAGPAAQATDTTDNCSALAQFGAFDTRPSLSDPDRADSFRNWLCQANISLESDLRVATAALGISADVLEQKFGFDPNGTADFLDWKHGLCATIHSDQHVADAVTEFVKAITPGTQDALAACDKPPGLHARLESTARQCTFLVHLGWTPSPEMSAPKDVQVIATNPHVVCDPNALQTPIAVSGPTDLTCTRHDDTAMVVMVAAPSARVTRLDHLMELPQALPDPEDLLAGEYQVDIAWRDRSGRTGTPTSDTWKLDLSNGACKITGSGTQYSPRSAWFNQARAECSTTQISFTGYRLYDPLAKKPAQFNLVLRSEDSGASFTGGGGDSLGNIAVQATARHKGAETVPDQLVCKP